MDVYKIVDNPVDNLIWIKAVFYELITLFMKGVDNFPAHNINRNDDSYQQS